MTGPVVERCAPALVLVHQDRELLQRLRLGFILSDWRVHVLAFDLRRDQEPPSWVTAERLIRERLGDPFLLKDLAEAVQGRTDVDAELLLDRLEKRAALVARFRAATAEADRRARDAELLAALDRIAP